LLTLGIVTGVVAAPERWGGRWYLDTRTVSTLVAWAVYAAYLGLNLGLGWRGRRTTWFLIAGFVAVSVAFAASIGRPKGTQPGGVSYAPAEEGAARAVLPPG
jgi:ABC-type transport system involved in cytochrome c biogenesis permease subunit